MVIDGFKSYGHRTEINGFDPAFNAITGLNGSGKSNILDAICFLMGISNLSHVRIFIPILLRDTFYSTHQKSSGHSWTKLISSLLGASQ